MPLPADQPLGVFMFEFVENVAPNPLSILMLFEEVFLVGHDLIF